MTAPGVLAKYPRAIAAIGLAALALTCLWLRPPPWIISSAADAKLSARRRGKVLVLITRTLEDGIEFGKTVMTSPELGREDFIAYTDLIPDGRSEGERLTLINLNTGAKLGHVVAGAHGTTAGLWNVSIFRPNGDLAGSFTPETPGPYEHVTAADMVAWVRFADGRGPAPVTPEPDAR